jgi:phosphohistidine phosphatase
MIRIYLVRHGIAVEHAERGELPDESRPLTDKGRRRFRRLARAFARLNEPIDQLFTSPLPRAVQTAEILAGALKQSGVGILESLRPTAQPETMLLELSKKANKDALAIGLVGHDPQMTLLVSLLGGAAREVEIDFKKGAIVRIDVSDLSGKAGAPQYWLKPKSRILAKGLPLAKAKKPAPEKQAKKTAAK